MKIAVLDDFERAAAASADWSAVEDFASVEFFARRIADRGELVSVLRDFEVVVLMRERTAFPRELIEVLPALRLLVTTGARNAAIDLEATAERGITICGTTSFEGSPVELTWALILAAARRLDQSVPAMRDGGWPADVGLALKSRVLGVLGLGRVGAAVARVGAAFGMEVLAWSPSLAETDAAAAGARLVPRDTLLRSSDVVTIHAGLSEATRRMIGAREFAVMKPTAWFVNTARGGLVDTAALVGALESGLLQGAALDVFEEEPLPANSPLRRLPNVLLTPHLGYVTDLALQQWYRDVVEDIVAWRAGAPVRIIS